MFRDVGTIEQVLNWKIRLPFLERFVLKKKTVAFLHLSLILVGHRSVMKFYYELFVNKLQVVFSDLCSSLYVCQVELFNSLWAQNVQ